MRKRLKDLLEFLKTTDLQEVTWEKKGQLIKLERSVAAKASASPSVPLPAGEGSAGTQAPSAFEVLVERPVIRSTMVGTFYRADSPNRPPLVVEGTQVSSGQPVGAIEAMKIMKDVVASQDCRIVKALVANGHAVEYGQPLFEVEPMSPNV